VQDGEGFTAFYERRRAQLHAVVAVTLGDHHLAAEAVDEAFVRAAERWSEVSRMERPAGWVYRVAVNWAMVLRFVLGHSVPETAVALEVAEGTVKSGVNRARQQLRADTEVADGTR
jgi:DNA-directed RNA polymerase specialized sigma24 family protein